MKTLYLECNMGAAGDMLAAALLELHPDPADFLRRVNALHIPQTVISAQPAVKCGICGTQVTVVVSGEEEHSEDVVLGCETTHTHSHTHEYHSHAHETSHTHEHHSHAHETLHTHEHHSHAHETSHTHEHHSHAGMHDIEHIIASLPLSEAVRTHVMAVYALIAEAESHAHGKPIHEIHFHEVGTMDAIADIVTVCMLLEDLAPEQILCSAIHVGSGQVRCAHGILPVPAPATAYILRSVPIYGGQIPGELCTPTGAALLRHFVTQFGPMPIMQVQTIGYGMGTKDFGAANCVRAMLGDTQEAPDTVYELCCNLDDMTAEAISFAAEQLLHAGALDVTTSAIQMKKGRPGTQLTCLCRPDQQEQMLQLFFLHTTTLGVREYRCSHRYSLQRTTHTADTPYGSIRIKRSSGWGVTREKAEYDDIAEIARREGLPLAEVSRLIKPE